MSQDLMNYDRMTQLALRGVVRDSIRRVIRDDGLPGAHHFYITFLTRYPGVDIDETLAKKYPEEVTIVIEHQFWDLKAEPNHFEVTLKFGGVPKFLSVPYLAITRFHDPSVGFAMQFDPPEEMKDSPPTLARLKPGTAPKPKPVKKARPGKDSRKPLNLKKRDPLQSTNPKGPVAQPSSATPDPTGAKSPKNPVKTDNSQNKNKVVSLDSFRKK